MNLVVYPQVIDISGLEVTSVGRGFCNLKGPRGTFLTLKNDFITFIPQRDSLVLKSRNSFRSKVKALVQTWASAVKRVREDKVWTYKVTALFKHFPVSFVVEEGVVKVLNYYGMKKPTGEPQELVVKTQRVMVKAIDPRNILISSTDRVHAGNVAARFYNLKYKSHTKAMDRRVYTDGCYVTLDS